MRLPLGVVDPLRDHSLLECRGLRTTSGFRISPTQGVLLFTSDWSGATKPVVQIGADSQQNLVYVSGPT